MTTRLCPSCGGSKVVMVPRATMDGDKMETSYVPEDCKTCKGKGHVPA